MNVLIKLDKSIGLLLPDAAASAYEIETHRVIRNRSLCVIS
jgi:hypothetical protein